MSQSFDLPNTTSTASTSDIPTRIENKWIPQPSTNLLKPPQIIEYGPLQGQTGDSFHVDLNSHNLDANTLRIAFNSCFTTCHCTLNTVTQIITLHTTVPSATMVACNDMSRIPIYIVVVQDDKILDSWFIGYFAYHLTRKRASTEFNPIDMHAVNEESKRPRSDPFSMGYPAAAAAAASSSPSPQQQPNYYSLSAHQQQQQQQQQHAPYVGLPPTQPSPRQQREFYDDPSMYANSTSTNSNVAAAVAAAAGVYNTSTSTDPNQFQPYNPNYSSLSQQPQDNYMLPAIMSSMSQPASSAPLQAQPPSTSITTTTSSATVPSIQMKPTMPLPISTTPIMSHSSAMASANTSTASSAAAAAAAAQQTSPTGNPFANLLNKANLIIKGDLADVLKDWSSEEWENQRRLVQFYRKQEGNEVTCRFETFHLPAEKSKQPDMNKVIVVSCIYWKEKNEYFVTSVDCIYLLEHLIGVKFTVEEKNRIRRNLEGYKPLTVSKLKPESAEFFKLIMGFPNPKPRNIEKDVKVFPWTTLGIALKKIISKYTASYSSTASVNYDLLNTADR